MANPRPRRPGEDFSRTHYEDGPVTKKPRFDPRNPSALAPDALEDDVTLDADEIGRRGQQVKRNAVNIDGYDSDSDNENFDARAAARAKVQEKSKAEDENDMFADLEEPDGDDDDRDETRRGGKKKPVRFLEENEIEGQIVTSKSGGHVSADFSLQSKGKARDDQVESSSDSEVDDAMRADVGDLDEELGAGAKKEHAPKLDAFNMREEQEEGRFDDQGNFVRKAADPDAIHDVWLDGLSKKDMKKAAEAAEKREQERRQKDIDDDSKLTSDLLATLIRILDRGETCLEALARLGKGKSKPKWQKNKNRKKNGIDVEMEEDDPAEIQRKATIETLTDAADLLLGRGQPEIYDTEREMLIRQYQRETGEDWQEPTNGEDDGDKSGQNSWEYRWSDARDGGEIHGPYDGEAMLQWSEAGYFGEGVEFRRVGSQEEWSRLVDFV